ncbi:MAG: hypothetical protein Q9202_001563 [Teloschistes flavicans]
MPSRKLNEYLDTGFSDDDPSSSHDSDNAQESKGRSTIPNTGSKRQKTSHESSDEASDDENDPVMEDSQPDNPDETSIPSEPIPTDKPTPKYPTPQKETETKVQSSTNTAPLRPSPKPGVIYLSRIPPSMRPSTVRHLLSLFGTITHLFLTPEAPSQRTARLSHGGPRTNRRRIYIDGWIQFQNHKSAKTCVAAINGKTMGGRGWYRDDVWNVRYLRGYRWEDLMAEVRGEEREREERVRVGLRREKREREGFLKGVEEGKKEETRRKKREDREKKDAGKEVEDVNGGKKGFERRFRQNEVKVKKSAPEQQQSEEVKRVLSKIF